MENLTPSRHHPADIVEVGVWRGGSMAGMAMTLLSLPPSHLRQLHLYDTFEGMTPTEHDHLTYNGQIPPNGRAAEQLLMSLNVKAYAGLDEVQATMGRTGYPASLIQYHVGPIERTLPPDLPGAIAILRLDTDWYESTAWELNNMHDRVSSGGVVILDDYGA